MTGGVFINKQTIFRFIASIPPFVKYILDFISIFAAFFLVELLAFLLLKPGEGTGLVFGALWSGILTSIILCLPKMAGRIVFGIAYFLILLWTLAQTAYYQIFGKLMWLSTIGYAGEGADYLTNVLSNFSLLWWFGMIFMLGLGILLIWKFPSPPKKLLLRLPYCISCAVCLVFLYFLPWVVFQKDVGVWGTHSEYGQSYSYRAIYNTMYDTKRVYNITGIYHLTYRDFRINELYPLTPGYRAKLSEQTSTVDAYFSQRGKHTPNSMTGTLAGKNVVVVLMESMDDWMITEEDTPTICRLKNEGISFTNFYTPGYGSARTLNSEFCINTGVYLPTTGRYVFNYVINSFQQSLASQLKNNGYTGHIFHYNDSKFYSRGVFAPAMGYESYVSYKDYTQDKNLLFSDTLLFDLPQVEDLFFRDGPTFNMIITRSAHLSYRYNEVLGHYALQKYPEYKGAFGSEEEDCARLKAKLVDDMFARLLQELESHGQLENTVIIAMTDHYTYGYENVDELYSLSGVDEQLLLEQVPCFIWAADGPDMEVTKTLNTSDLLPTVLNLLGIDSPYQYLGQDAFDPAYKGYALFPDGSWICDGVAWQNGKILMNAKNRTVSQEEIQQMAALSAEYRNVSNLLLTCDYYQ